MEKVTTKYNSTHGYSYTRFYKCWQNLKDRCYRIKNKDYVRYGGRGIQVCERWLKFENFRADMERTYFPGATVDRLNRDGNYEPANCRWATSKQQGNNRTTNRLVTYNGVTLSIAQWSEVTGIARATIGARLNAGWAIYAALYTKSSRSK